MQNWKVLMAAVAVVTLITGTTWAYRVTVSAVDDPSQDFLGFAPTPAHELGNLPPFPTNEWINSMDSITSFRPCPMNPDTGIPNYEVSITNMTNTFWSELIYVADPETTLQNYDGRVNGELAFWIDNIGINVPLTYESLNQNLIFEPGETWTFVIQDYMNALGGPASAFDSLGVPSAGWPPSTGSIVALVPEPETMLLLALGSLTLYRRKR